MEDTQSPSLKIEVSDLNCHVRWEGETLPGLNRMLGGPGAGKSTILSALALAEDAANAPKDAAWKLRLQVRHGAPARGRKRQAVGQVRLPGIGGTAGYDVSPSGSVVALEPLPSIHFLPGEAFAELTRHGRKSQDTADKAELAAFGEMVGIDVTPEQLAPPELAEIVRLVNPGKLPAVAAEVRKMFNADALRFKGERETLQAKLDAQETLKDAEALKLPVGTVDEERAALRTAEGKSGEVRMIRHGRGIAASQVDQLRSIQPSTRPDASEVLAKLAEARAALTAELDASIEGLPPEPDVSGAHQASIDAGEKVNTIAVAMVNAQQTIDRLMAQLAIEQERLSGLTVRYNDAFAAAALADSRWSAVTTEHTEWTAKKAIHDQRKHRVAAMSKTVDDLDKQARAVEQAGKDWDGIQAMIDVPPVDPAVVAAEDAIVADVAVRADAVRMAERKDRETARKAQENTLKMDLDAKQEQEDAYRLAAGAGLQECISRVLESAGIEGWAIEDGQLCCADPTRNGALTPLRNMSDSLRDTAVAELMITRAKVPDGKTPMLVLRQDVTEGMVLRQRLALDAMAKAHGIHILTAGHDDDEGPLRIERIE